MSEEEVSASLAGMTGGRTSAEAAKFLNESSDGIRDEATTKRSMSNAYASADREREATLSAREQGLADLFDPVEDARISRIEEAYGDNMTASQRLAVGSWEEVRAAARKAGTLVGSSDVVTKATTAVTDAEAERDAVYARADSTQQERSDAEMKLYNANKALDRAKA